MNTPQAKTGVEVERLEFFDKETGDVRTNHEYFVLNGEVYRDNYNTYESQCAVIGFDDCIVRVPEIGWRLASLAAERAEAVRMMAALRDAIFELEYSGMAYDHPKLVSLRAALSPSQGAPK